MASLNKDMSDATVSSITISKNSKIKISGGVGIGSKAEEVIKTFCVGMYVDDYIDRLDDNGEDSVDYHIFVSSFESGLLGRFSIRNEKVSEISIYYADPG